MRKKTLGAGVLAAGAALAIAGAVPTASASTAAQAASTLQPPPVTVLTDTVGGHRGDIFVSPFGDTATYANGAEILSPDGKKVIWFHPAPAGQEDSDFRTQTYRGKPVLTFWEGAGLGGVSTGADYIYDNHYKLIAKVSAGNGYSADGHEFLITPWNTALILSYTTATADLTKIGGPANQTVIDGLLQEVDIKTGKVIFQWDSAGHVPYSESEQPLPASASSPWDWFHINAVKLDTNGNLLVSARNTWTTYEVSPHSGDILWRLGGKSSSFALQAANGQALDNAGDIFAWQHDPEDHGHGIYTLFDNDAAGAANTSNNILVDLPYSRAVTVKLNVKAHTATLLATDNQPENLSAPSQGNAQLLGNGNLFVGWGSLPYLSEFGPSGQLLFNAEFPAGVNSYRAYRLQWNPAATNS